MVISRTIRILINQRIISHNTVEFSIHWYYQFLGNLPYKYTKKYLRNQCEMYQKLIFCRKFMCFNYIARHGGAPNSHMLREHLLCLFFCSTSWNGSDYIFWFKWVIGAAKLCENFFLWNCFRTSTLWQRSIYSMRLTLAKQSNVCTLLGNDSNEIHILNMIPKEKFLQSY